MTYLPLKLFVGFIVGTLLFSFFGPMEYENFDRASVAVYMAAFLLIFSLSYALGVGQASRVREVANPSPSKRTLTLVTRCIVIVFFVKAADLIAGIVANGLHISLGDLGTNYVNLYADYVRNSGRAQNLMFFVNLPLALPAQAAMVLGTYYFRSLSKLARVMLIATFFIVLLANTVQQGKQKQLGDIVIFLLAVVLIKYASEGVTFRKRARRIALVLGLLGIAAFAFILDQRYAAVGITLANYNAKASAQTSLNLDHPIFKIFGEDLGFALTMLLTGYLSGGYYGLSLCLHLPFKWTYFLGSSYSMMVLFSRFFGTAFFLADTYPVRMEDATGYTAMTKWHTIFPWIASDFTFVGALLVLGALGYVYAICWREATVSRKPLSILLFAVMTLGLIFVPANNQLMIAPDGVIGVAAIGILWAFRHRLARRRQQVAPRGFVGSGQPVVGMVPTLPNGA